MCLIVFSWNPDSDYPLVVLANRDEFHQRPTQAIHYWKDDPDILGGKDLQSGGSWLAFSNKARLAAVTNYREVPAPESKLSRGKLVKDFVCGTTSSTEYLSQLSDSADLYSGFNLLVWDGKTLCYFSNRMNEIKTLATGIYGLCNHLLDTPWPKLVKAKRLFSDHLKYQTPDHDQLIKIMNDNEQAAAHLLPNTGIGLENERQLSSCFIKGENYGTRNTSALILDSKGSFKWVEQNYASHGVAETRQHFQVNLTSPAMIKED